MRDIYRKLYTQQKSNAKQRGVGFLLSLEDWKSIWSTSGKWDQRGRGSEKYCMCRVGDNGAYELGNVFIAKNKQNLRDGNLGRVPSDAVRKKISQANSGTAHPWSTGDRNPMHRLEVKAKISAATSGFKHYKSIGVTTPTGFYGCTREAAEAMGMKKPTVEWRARHKKFGFHYGATP